MKKLNLFFAMFLMVTAGIMTSCNKDSEIAPTVAVTVVGSPSYEVGTEVELSIAVATGNEELNTLAVTGATGTLSGDLWDDASSKFVAATTEATVTYKFTITEPAGTEFDVDFVISDDSENTATDAVTIVVAAPAGDIKAFTVTLGDQAGSEGSSLNLATGDQYNSSTSAANAGSIDLIFYKGSTNGSTLFAPAQAFSEGISDFLSLGTWSAKSNTTFKMATADDYDNASYSNVEGLSDGGDHKANNLTGTEYIAFKTDAGLHGVIKVNSVVARKDALGTTNISVKVQEPAASK